MDHRTLLLVIAIALPGISVLGGAWVGAGWIWDGANAIGFSAAALVIFLHIETGAARSRPAPQAAFHARLHTNVAVLALALVALHAGALLADDRLTIEYWKLSAPTYMLAGLGGALLFVALIASSYPQPRRFLFKEVTQFRRLHGTAALTLSGLIAWHIAGCALYLDTPFKQAVCGLALVGLPLWLLRRPARQRPIADALRREPGTANREVAYIGAGAVCLAVVYSLARNLL